MSQFHNSVVHLSIVKIKPSFTEPWRKFPPVSLVGTGAIIPWKEASSRLATDTMPNAEEVRMPSCENNEEEKEDGSTINNTTNTTIRILTNAHTVQYATSIRARTQNSPISVGCTVEWISLAMDLALLKLVVELAATHNEQQRMPPGWNAIALPPATTTHLPHLGEAVACIQFPTTAISDMSAPISMQHFGRYASNSAPLQGRQYVDLTMHRGTVAGYSADEEEHHMLRMKMNLHMPIMAMREHNALNANDGGGLVVDGNGHFVGMVASSSQADLGVHSIIPGLVIDRFLNLCNHTTTHGVTSQPCHHGASASGISYHTDGECSAAASRDTGGETSQSDQGNQTPNRPRRGNNGINKSNTPSDGIQHLPGIPTLGITGFQTIANKALRRTLGLVDCDDTTDGGVRILGINHTVHPTIDDECQSHCKEDKKCNTSMLRTDDVLLAVDDEPIRLDGTVRLAPGRDNERVDFRWLISQQYAGAAVTLHVVRHRKRIQLHATLAAPRHLVPKCDEGEDDSSPSYVICGGCVFVPLTQCWLAEMAQMRTAEFGRGANHNPPLSELQGFQRYLQEQRKGDQQIIILSHVLADEVNVGYHGMGNMVLTSVNGQRPINNLSALMDLLVKRESGQSLEFRCSYIHLDRAKVVICMDAKEVMDSETRIMSNHMINSWCSNTISLALKKEAEGKSNNRHGTSCCGLNTMRALRNAVRETTLVVRRPITAGNDDTNAVAATRRIMDFSEAHKMQSAPLFAGKYTEEGGWTQVKTKHLSQLCTCGKSTRFYCICSVGTMRCKDCFIKHCRDHTSQHECSVTCAPDCEAGAEVIAEGVELVTTKKRKRNNPTQAIQSRCVVCKAKTCYCCSACGFEKEVALCHVSTGRNCLPIHTSEHHTNSKCGHGH